MVPLRSSTAVSWRHNRNMNAQHNHVSVDHNNNTQHHNPTFWRHKRFPLPLNPYRTAANGAGGPPPMGAAPPPDLGLVPLSYTSNNTNH